MKKSTIKKTPYYSYRIGKLPKGCQLCVRGEKLVMFVTGICNRRCFYCPLSNEKKSNDVVYANESNIKINLTNLREEQLKEIIKEAKLCSAKGAGITGGDPLLVLDRTVIIIKKLKKEFGKKFHIHLYTILKNITHEKLQALYNAGLDEIRFHPLIWNNSEWSRLKLARRFDWDIGIEIPSIPKYEMQTEKLLDFLDTKIDSLTINELEISDTNANQLLNLGHIPKNKTSYAVLGSERLALKLIQYCLDKKYKFNIHYCTSKLKDAVQLSNRIKRRANNIANKFDIITKEGLLIRGAIYLKRLSPSFSYRRILKSIDKNKKEQIISKLSTVRKSIINKFKLKNDSIVIDESKLRLITSTEIIKKIKDKLKSIELIPVIVEEYPTSDAIEIEIEFL